jgi:dynein heavy chain
VIESFQVKIEKAKEREGGLANGLQIFAIPSTEHKDLSAVIKDVDFLQQIWTLTIEWAEYWDKWKSGQFRDLDVENMENIAGNYAKKVGKLGRDIKKWKVWEAMKGELDLFREVVPLIQDMRNPGT